MIKFSIKIDDDEHSLSSEDGIPVNEIGGLLETLFAAIDTSSGEKLTLGQIRTGSYVLDFYSNDAGYEKNFVRLHKDIDEIPFDDLLPEQRKYVSKLSIVLGDKYKLTAYDKEQKEVAIVNTFSKSSLPNFYYTTDTVYGIIIELGRPSLGAKKHISIPGISYKIFISEEQDLTLKKLYGTHHLQIELKQKRSVIDGHIVNSELDSFTIISGNSLTDNLKTEGYIDFHLIEDTNTIEDILDRIYANK